MAAGKFRIKSVIKKQTDKIPLNSNRLGGFSKAFLFKKAVDGIGWNGALFHPIGNTICFQCNLRRFYHWVICSNVFKKAAIPRESAVRHNDSVKGFLLGTMPCQPDFYCH
jgi:hypothetical protein